MITLDLTKELKITVEHEGNDNTSNRWYAWNTSQRLITDTKGLGIQRKNRNHIDQIISKMNKYTQKNLWGFNYPYSSERPKAKLYAKNLQGVK